MSQNMNYKEKGLHEFPKRSIIDIRRTILKGRLKSDREDTKRETTSPQWSREFQFQSYLHFQL